MRYLWVALLCCLAGAAGAQQAASNAPIGVLRMLDKTNGRLLDLEMAAGQTSRVGPLTITLSECRYPAGSPGGDAYALLRIAEESRGGAIFEGWMIASSPALNPLDHPRFDVWVLRCRTS